MPRKETAAQRETDCSSKAVLQTVNICNGVPVQPPHCLPITHCAQMAHQQPRAALVWLQQSIHESQVFLLGCRPFPACYHTGEGSQVL